MLLLLMMMISTVHFLNVRTIDKVHNTDKEGRDLVICDFISCKRLKRVIFIIEFVLIFCFVTFNIFHEDTIPQDLKDSIEN